jgi:hypothetical protein
MKKYIVFFMAITALLLSSMPLSAASDVQVIARLILSSGSIQFKPDGSAAWKKAVSGMSLAQGDVLRTGDAAFADLYLANGSMVRIGANSTLELSKLGYDMKQKAMKMSLKINPVGRIIAAIKKLKKDANQLDIYTPQAVVGVRGTDLLVDVPDQNTTVTGVWDGQVIVKDFVSESGLSSDDNTMTLNFVHEITVGKNEFSTYKKAGGFTHPKNLSASYEKDKAVIPALKDQSAKIMASDSADKQVKALALRKEALK